MPNDIKVQITLDGKNYSSAAGKVIAINKQMAKSAQEAGHATVSQMQASSAAIRTLENPLGNNIRAIERLLTTIPGVGKALQLAFPVFGVIALGSALVRATTQVVKFVKELQDMPNAVSDGFRQLNGSAQQTNDELKLTNDTLRNHIALMEHKPQNNVAIALDEARIMADKLAASLRTDQKEVENLLKANSIGMMGELLGKGGTADVEGTIKYGEREMADLGQKYNDAVHSGDKTGAAKALKDLKAKQDYYRKWAADQAKMRTGQVGIQGGPEMGTQAYASAYGNQDTNLRILSGFGTSIGMRQEAQSLEGDHAALSNRDKQLKGGEQAAKLQKEVFEAERQAYFDQFADDQRTKRDSDETAEDTRKTLTKVLAPDEQDLSRNSDTAQYLSGSGKDTLSRLKGMNESINLTRQYNDALKEQGLDQAVATGALNTHDAAIQKANLNYQKYINLRDQMVKQGASADDLQKAGNDYQLESNADQALILNTSFKGKWQETLNEMGNEFSDFGGNMTAVFKQTVDNVNEEIVHLLTTKHHNSFETKRAFEGIAKTGLQGVTSASLKKLEGMGLKALHIGGKADGSKGNPFHVVMDAAGNLDSSASGIAGGSGGFLSSVLGFVAKIGGAFATGGPVGGDVPVVVGERGPEVFWPNSAGRIIPNNQIGAGGGDTHHHTYNVDARHSTDAATTAKMVHRALLATASKTVAASQKASADMRSRRPRLSA
jgi:hypothetical protein